jgi:hypothetical protein
MTDDKKNYLSDPEEIKSYVEHGRLKIERLNNEIMQDAIGIKEKQMVVQLVKDYLNELTENK